jgi:hypothetical protein
MSVHSSVDALVDTLRPWSLELEVLVESALALAAEVDAAQIPDKEGRTKSAAGAVRELRAVVDELLMKGRRDADDDDWSSPVADLAEVRDAAKRKPADARPRSRGGRPKAG